MTIPAARITDLHVCPAFDGAKPHTGGPILPPGCPTVHIGGLPASTFADRATCAGPPDAILAGAATVLVGGLPAARIGSVCAHGGSISSGALDTLVGGAAVSGGQCKLAAGVPNTFIAYDATLGQLYIVSYLEFSGPGATAEYAAAAASQIANMWGGKRTVRGKPCAVHVQIRTSVNTSSKATDGYDVIRVDAANPRSNQTLGGGPGQQKPSDATGPEHVAAHEFGHTLGLDDQYMDQPDGTSAPDPSKTQNTEDNVMCQTWKNPNTGEEPHPYEEHYNAILTNFGL